MNRIRIALGLALGVLAAAPALPTDGVIEINQAKALAGGVTVGDGAGYPVLISQPGSYRLTGNLDLNGTMATAGTPAITVTADDVVIDLNGFSMRGVLMGTGLGITGNVFFNVRNGFLEYFGGGCLDLGTGLVENVVAKNCGVVGISVGNGVVRNSLARNVSGIGINVESGTIQASVAMNNTTAGFQINNGSLRDSFSEANGTDEFVCDSLCAYGGNVLSCTDFADCFGGAGTFREAPVGSNVCAGGACP